jgi:hypothetical protein
MSTAEGARSVPAAANTSTVQPSSFHNTILQDETEKVTSVYVIPENMTVPVVQLKSYENKAFEGSH